MFKHILVPTSGLPGDQEAFEVALMIAQQNSAHLQFLHIRLDVTSLIVAMAKDGIGSATYMQSDTINRFEADGLAQEAKAREAVTAFCAHAGLEVQSNTDEIQRGKVSAEFTVGVDDPIAGVAKVGRFADLVVTRRPVAGQMSTGLIDATLTAVGRPVIIAGRATSPSLSNTVLIA